MPGTLINHLKSFRRKHIQTAVIFREHDIPKCQHNRPLYVIQSAEGRNMTSVTPVGANGNSVLFLMGIPSSRNSIQSNSILYSFINAGHNSPKTNYKANKNKQTNNTQIKTKQSNLCHLDLNHSNGANRNVMRKKYVYVNSLEAY
jgi:ribosomal protein L35